MPACASVNRLARCLGAILMLAMALPAAAEMDVDQADSLNFHAFHRDKKEAVKIWRGDNDELQAGHLQEPIKVYEAADSDVTYAPVPMASVSAKPERKPDAVPGQRFEIRERYTLTRSASTPYSAFYVIEAMHRQMAEQCPQGWRKLTERSEPVESDYWLYYTFECL